ncbi:MAG: cysteine methyltransferase [Myxococcaceae bacterium]|nr:cysteine methyltransferase [Myxococcaceae bacterium]
MTPPATAFLDSPVGRLTLLANDGGLCGVYFPDHKRAPVVDAEREPDHPALRAARQQLAEFFRGQRDAFDLPLAPAGTAFQRRVWAALRAIPFGETRHYGALAAQLGQPTAARAVGLANGRNPLSIVVPCHRVVGRDGSLTGYAGGLDAKRWLLAHEGRAAG